MADELREAWVADQWSGPRQVALHAVIGDKALVLFHGNPQLVDASHVHDSEEAAYTAAWLMTMDYVGTRMEAGKRFKQRADELRKETGK